MGGKAARWLPKHPPSPKWRVGGSKVAGLFFPPTWGPAKNLPPITWLGEREGGKTRHFSKYSLIKGYFKRPISQNISAKLAPSLLQCQSLPISFLRAVIRENVPYIATQAYVRPAKMTSHFQSATQHSTGNISAEGSEHQEQSRPQQHTWNSKLFVIFLLTSTAAHSLNFQHLLCGLRLKVQELYSKRSLSLVMFMLAS